MQTAGYFEFSETFSKGALSSTRRFRILQLPFGVFPGLDWWLHHLLSVAPPSACLLGLAFPQSNKLQAALLAVGHLPGVSVQLLSSHCIRVGTCSCLLKLGLSESAIKQWVGWAPSSQAWEAYARNPVFSAEECAFVRHVFS